MITSICLAIFVLISILHYFPSQHWVFRFTEFAKIQLTVLQSVVILAIFFMYDSLSHFDLVVGLVLLATWIHNLIILLPYSPLYPRESKKLKSDKKNISFLSVNVFQYNEDYNLLIKMINRLKPDILLTIESDKKWEKALEAIEGDYSSFEKIPQDNTYGLHFYTKLETKNIKVNHFIANDLPSIEADLLSKEKVHFKFFGIHPPPPSPTEEETSKERDGEILMLAEYLENVNIPRLVVGDFNNVAWSRSSKLFKKATKFLDPRIGRGFISTFHAKYKLFRFPIDLVFHCEDIYINNLRTEKPINSDHFPIYGEFVVCEKSKLHEPNHEELNSEEEEQVDEFIEEGKKVESKGR